MATIQSLNTSITCMGRAELMTKLMAIRDNRRRKPERAMRANKSTPAKVARAPKKTNLKQQDIFAFTKGMTDEMEANLAAQLLGGLK